MEKISDRIRMEEESGNSAIVIAPFRDQQKQRLLVIWILLWSFCGLYVASRLFMEVPAKERIVYFVFLAFWAYFEYMTLHTALWRAYGEERLWLKEGELLYERGVGKRRRRSSIPINSISSVRLLEADDRSFSQHFESSYYVIGRMRLEIEHEGNFTRLGEKISDREARYLVGVIEDKVRDPKKRGE